MIILGIILLVVGLVVATLHVLVIVGAVVLAVGLILALLGATGHAIGRAHYF